MKVLVTIFTDLKNIHHLNILKDLNYDYEFDGIDLKILIDIKNPNSLKTFYKIILLNVLKDSRLYFDFKRKYSDMNFKKIFFGLKYYNKVIFDLGNYKLEFRKVL